MAGTDWLVIGGATGAIIWVNWYFFVAGRSVAAIPSTGVAQPESRSDASGTLQRVARGAPSQLVITVDGGYSPNLVRVPVGRPVQLVFDRRDDSSCSEEVVLPDFGIRRFLPRGERTTVEITVPAPGRYPFTCGMSMLRGTIIADV